MKRNKILSCIACGSQTHVAQAYHDQNLESSLGVILIFDFVYYVGLYTYIFFNCCHYVFLLINLSQILDVVFLMPVSIFFSSSFLTSKVVTMSGEK